MIQTQQLPSVLVFTGLHISLCVLIWQSGTTSKMLTIAYALFKNWNCTKPMCALSIDPWLQKEILYESKRVIA